MTIGNSGEGFACAGQRRNSDIVAIADRIEGLYHLKMKLHTLRVHRRMVHRDNGDEGRDVAPDHLMVHFRLAIPLRVRRCSAFPASR